MTSWVKPQKDFLDFRFYPQLSVAEKGFKLLNNILMYEFKRRVVT
jgi:hypothetical protein